MLRTILGYVRLSCIKLKRNLLLGYLLLPGFTFSICKTQKEGKGSAKLRQGMKSLLLIFGIGEVLIGNVSTLNSNRPIQGIGKVTASVDILT